MKVSLWCQCGASITGSVSGRSDESVLQAMLDRFYQLHEGHFVTAPSVGRCE